MGLEGKRALLTGGTAGIGAAAAGLFVADGAEEVVIAGRDEERGAAAVDVLINNAAAFPVAPTLEQTVEGFEAMFDINVRGLFFLTKALVPAMLAKGDGGIVNSIAPGPTITDGVYMTGTTLAVDGGGSFH